MDALTKKALRVSCGEVTRKLQAGSLDIEGLTFWMQEVTRELTAEEEEEKEQGQGNGHAPSLPSASREGEEG